MPTDDFNGDGRSDILWRSSDVIVSNWLGQSDGSFVINDANALIRVPLAWTVVGTGDFNGDGRSDLLWRHSSGTLSNWLGTASGGWIINDASSLTQVPTDWHVVGVGDFNGDGRDDILWRNASGQLSNWLGTASGGWIGNGLHRRHSRQDHRCRVCQDRLREWRGLYDHDRNVRT